MIQTTPTSMKTEAKVYVPEDQTNPLAASVMNLDVTVCILGFGFGFNSLDISDIQWHSIELHWIMTETITKSLVCTCQSITACFTSSPLHGLWQ